jgi:hypothetical protein
MRLKQDVVFGGGEVARLVQALRNDVLARQLGRRDEGVKEGTGIGKKIIASVELVLQGRSANTLARGGVGTESAWKEAIALGMKRAMRLELEYLVHLKSSLSGVTYAAFRKVTGAWRIICIVRRGLVVTAGATLCTGPCTCGWLRTPWRKERVISKAVAVRSARVEMGSVREKRRRHISYLGARRWRACGNRFTRRTSDYVRQ